VTRRASARVTPRVAAPSTRSIATTSSWNSRNPGSRSTGDAASMWRLASMASWRQWSAPSMQRSPTMPASVGLRLPQPACRSLRELRHAREDYVAFHCGAW